MREFNADAIRLLGSDEGVNQNGEFDPVVKYPDEGDVAELDEIRPVLAHQVRHGSLR